MSRRGREVLGAAVGVGVCFLVLLQLFGTYQNYQNGNAIRDTQQNGSPTSVKLLSILSGITDQQADISQSSQNSRAVLDQLQDCLQPAGKCYRDSKQRTAVFLQLAGVYTSCAVGYAGLPDNQRIEATQECVARWTRTQRGLSSSSSR